MFKKAKEISDDKVQIAIQTYELVDKHIRKLDSDLAKFESEMKVVIVVMSVSDPHWWDEGSDSCLSVADPNWI